MKVFSKMRFTSVLLVLLLVILMAVPAITMAAELPVNLGTTSTFAVLAGSTITNTGATTINGSAGGDIGVSPGSAVTGFPPGTVSNGSIHTNDAAAIQAQVDLVTAYNDAAGRSVTTDLTGQDLGGLTLTSGVYHFDTSAQLTGTVTLDAQGDSDAVFIFQIGSTLTTASNSVISIINGARFCRIFWQVGSSATLGTSTIFVGHIFALTSITANTGVIVQGQLLARNGAVTLDTNTIINGICEITSSPQPTPTPTATPQLTPTPTATPQPTPASTPTSTPASTPTSTPASTLPKTGGFPAGVLYGLGALLTGAGYILKRKSR